MVLLSRIAQFAPQGEFAQGAQVYTKRVLVAITATLVQRMPLFAHLASIVRQIRLIQLSVPRVSIVRWAPQIRSRALQELTARKVVSMPTCAR